MSAALGAMGRPIEPPHLIEALPLIKGRIAARARLPQRSVQACQKFVDMMDDLPT